MDTRTIIEKAGGPAQVAKLFGISIQAVSAWKRIPANRCIDLERALGGSITRHDMRPDVFGPKPKE